MRRITGGRGFWSPVTAGVLALSSLVVASLPATNGAASSGYVSFASPARLVDTRPGGTTIDGQDAGIGLRAAGTTTEFRVGGRAGVPTGAAAVLTVTAVDPSATGFLTVHPAGTARPNASDVNFYAADNTANTVVAALGVDDEVSVYTSTATLMIVDVAGYFPAGDYSALPNPVRLADTRPGLTTIDGQYAGIGLRSAGSTLEVQVAGRGGVPASATTAVLTVTAADPVAAGFVTVHATGTARPNASNVNYYGAHNMANTVLAPIGTDGKVSLYTSAATQLIVDVSGEVIAAAQHTPLPNSARLADTRPGAVTVDGLHAGDGIVAGGYSLQLPVAGRAGVPANVSAAVLTVTAVDPTDVGFVTVHPTGTARPNASNVNYYAAHNTTNTVISRIGAGGDVCIFASAATQLVVDVSGWFTGPAPAPAGPTCPQPPPLPAIWPAANVLFSTPEAAAEDFIAEVFGVQPVLGPFQAGDSLSGEIEVLSQLDDNDPTTTGPTGATLLLRRLGADLGWFVIAAVSDGVTITSPESMDVVAAGPTTVEGLGRGFEANVIGSAFVAGVGTPVLDVDFTMTDWTIPTPYSMTLDLSGASTGDVVGLLVESDSGLGRANAEFAALPVFIG